MTGIRTGTAYADESLGDVLLAAASHRNQVLRTALETLLVSPFD